ncbi:MULTISPECIES: ABC transporter permease [Cyanophyceae]|uniref:ABC transporter permease n=1 Tax=Cyanophyceae TaxID=3028117 RepID=UPI0016832C25|nr:MULTISPECIES: ABC transporter permease [Cyanophyceae]MBD1917527.1 ABC transporter permease [Phormidium sp. FACHB-77]MBD2029598.1 ABC transporter permease [Phormidium sp. FACHB-322]MBD2050859.1 ABC transporter permease [Leptolyngbya sp. FACHB-60]
MTWWRKLRTNRLAQLGAILLIALYAIALGADFFAPYSPYESQLNGSLLPPTQVYWRDAGTGRFFPHVYPTTQGPVDINTGERKIVVDRTQPSALRIFHRNDEERLTLFDTAGPARINLLGTDEQARDQLSRLIYGSRVSLSVGLIGIAISFPLGMLVGGMAGYFGGAVDAVLMRLVEVLMTIPSIYLLVALAAVLPAGISSTQRFLLIVLITSLVGWAGLARVIRGQVLSIKEQEFVQASRVMGGRSLYIITRHILPQTATYGIIAATLAIPGFILAEAVLSFIGLGIQQPDASWGNMLTLATNASILVLQPWLVWPPAILIVVTSLAFNLLGDGLRDALDPRTLKQ